MNYFFWGIRERPARRPCDPRLLKQLGVREEVCEAIQRQLDKLEPGE